MSEDHIVLVIAVWDRDHTVIVLNIHQSESRRVKMMEPTESNVDDAIVVGSDTDVP